MAYSYVGSDDARPLEVLVFGQISRERLKQPPQAVPLAFVLGEIVSIWGRPCPFRAEVGLLMAWWMDLEEAPRCGSSKGSSEFCDHSGFYPQVFPSCASVSSSEELWVKRVKGRDPFGRRPPQDNEFRRQKQGGEEAQSSVRHYTSALDAKTSF